MGSRAPGLDDPEVDLRAAARLSRRATSQPSRSAVRLAQGGAVGALRPPENPHALPRVQFVGGWQFADFESMKLSGRWPDTDPQQAVLLDAEPPAAAAEGPVKVEADVRLVRYRNAEGQGWDGQGAMPDWLHPAVNAGQRLDHFAVSDATRP